MNKTINHNLKNNRIINFHNHIIFHYHLSKFNKKNNEFTTNHTLFNSLRSTVSV